MENEAHQEPRSLDINQIRNILPHRYPFLMVDRVVKWEGKKIIAVKNVTANEPHFQGHFPREPVMPGVLIIEAMAQTAALMVHNMPENKDKLVYFAGISNARFRKVVQPGDQLRIEAEIINLKKSFGKARTQAFVDGEVAAEAELTFVTQK